MNIGKCQDFNGDQDKACADLMRFLFSFAQQNLHICCKHIKNYIAIK